MKQACRASGTFNTGTSGFGYVFVSPFNFIFNNTNPITWTDSTYPLTNMNAGTGSNTANSNSPFNNSNNSDALQVRLVACGLRVKNVTALLAKGGTLVGAESLNHTDMLGYTVASTLNMATAQRMNAVSEEWSSVVWHPVDEDEYDYVSFSAFNFLQNAHTLAFMAQVGDATQIQTYEWEINCAFECKGTIVQTLTPSLSDPKGLAIVQNATSTAADRKPWVGDRAKQLLPLLAKAGAYAYSAYKATTYAGAAQKLLTGPAARLMLTN